MGWLLDRGPIPPHMQHTFLLTRTPSSIYRTPDPGPLTGTHFRTLGWSSASNKEMACGKAEL